MIRGFEGPIWVGRALLDANESEIQEVVAEIFSIVQKMPNVDLEIVAIPVGQRPVNRIVFSMPYKKSFYRVHKSIYEQIAKLLNECATHLQARSINGGDLVYNIVEIQCRRRVS